MRMKKPAVVLATAAMIFLAACGGGSGDGDTDTSDDPTFQEGGQRGCVQEPRTLEALMEVLSDATEGGTPTVLDHGRAVDPRPDPGLLHRLDLRHPVGPGDRDRPQYLTTKWSPTTCS